MDKGGLFLVKVTYNDLGSLYFSTVPRFEIEEVYDYIKMNERIQEAMVLWTCNRFEIYFYPGDKETVEFIEDYVNKKAGKHSVVHGSDAIRHLFLVASGLDSMVIGENEILSQIKDAFRISEEEGLVGKNLNLVVNKALQVGKKVRSTSGNGRHNKSLASIAIDEMNLNANEKILIVGAGHIGKQVSHILKRKGLEFSITNRTDEKAKQIAQLLGCTVEAFDKEKWKNYDVLIMATKSEFPILGHDDIQNSHIKKILDLGVPPNVEENASDGVKLVNMKNLSTKVRDKEEEKEEFMRMALKTVEEEFKKFSTRMMNREKEEILRKIIDFSQRVIDEELNYMEKKVSSYEDLYLMKKGLESTRNKLLGFVINGIKRSNDVRSSETVSNMEAILDENLSRYEDEKVKKIG
ncbi:MAG: NAD(P)-binding domain-containing protein [Thermoplasmatales archaeon]